MKINIVSVGKFDDLGYQVPFYKYLQRINFCKLELKEINLKFSKGFEIEKIKQQECEAIIKLCKSQHCNILLDEHGKQLTSIAFANYLQELSSKEINFIIGGAYGVTTELKRQCHIMLSLSNLTLPHLMARALLCEQIFRAQTIINNHPYHKI
jgi:23S rRNA (pseudouridine1915-N3)-methyltransferase